MKISPLFPKWPQEESSRFKKKHKYIHTKKAQEKEKMLGGEEGAEKSSKGENGKERDGE